METSKFEQLVAAAIESLPEEFRERLENIDIVVADEPTRTQLRKSESKGAIPCSGFMKACR